MPSSSNTALTKNSNGIWNPHSVQYEEIPKNSKNSKKSQIQHAREKGCVHSNCKVLRFV